MKHTRIKKKYLKKEIRTLIITDDNDVKFREPYLQPYKFWKIL